MTKVKVLQMYVKHQGHVHKVKNYHNMWKVLSQRIHLQYESSICSGLKVLAKVEGSSFCSRTHADGDADTRASLWH